MVEVGNRKLAIEVKAAAAHRTLLSRSARSFIDAVNSDLFVTLHGGASLEQTYNRCRVVWTHPIHLSDERTGKLMV